MAVKITVAALRTIAPGAANHIIEGIVAHQHFLAHYGITTPQRVKHFLGQSACETAGFTRLEENLFYTTAARLRQVWPSRFPSDAAAAPYLRNPQKLANFVYGGRLGNTGADDGWLYRGSGCKQTTGKTNFAAVEKATKLPVVKQPDMLRRFGEALESACVYWRDNGLNRFADADDVGGLTRAIQGGSGGLADRRVYTDRAGRPPRQRPCPRARFSAWDPRASG
jgi:putative chitinase